MGGQVAALAILEWLPIQLAGHKTILWIGAATPERSSACIYPTTYSPGSLTTVSSRVVLQVTKMEFMAGVCAIHNNNYFHFIVQTSAQM